MVPSKGFSVKESGWIPNRITNKTRHRTDETSCTFNCHLAQWARLGLQASHVKGTGQAPRDSDPTNTANIWADDDDDDEEEGEEDYVG